MDNKSKIKPREVLSGGGKVAIFNKQGETMNMKLYFVAVLLTFSVLLGGCGKGETNASKSSSGPTNTAPVTSDDSDATDKKSGGQITIIAGLDKNRVLVRSSRFR